MKKYFILTIFFLIINLFSIYAVEVSYVVATNLFLECTLTIKNLNATYVEPSSGALFYKDPDNNAVFSISAYFDWDVVQEWEENNVCHIQVWNGWGTKIGDWKKRIQRDDWGPSFSVEPVSYPAWRNNEITLNATPTDSISGLNGGTQYRINGGAYTAGSSVTVNNTVNNLPSGIHTVTFRAYDKLGNSGIKNCTIRIDETTPEVTIVSDNSWSNNPLGLYAVAAATDTFSGENSYTWQSRINDGSWLAESGNNYRAFIDAEGETLINFRVKDNAGNLSDEAATYVRLDRTAPSIDITLLGENDEVLNDGWQNQNVRVVFNLSDENGGVTTSGLKVLLYHRTINGIPDSESTSINLYGSPMASPEISIPYEGRTTLLLNVRDELENETELTYDVFIDRVPPEITCTGTNGWTAGSSFTAAATAVADYNAVDVNTWQYRIDNDSWSAEGPGNNQVSVTTEGNHTVYFRVKDAIGQMAENSCQVQLDATPPELLVSGLSEWSSLAAFEATASAEDICGNSDPGLPPGVFDSSGMDEYSWEYSFDQTNWQPGDTVSVSAEGETPVYFRVKDMAGNISDPLLTYVRLDRTNPEFLAINPESWTKEMEIAVSITAGSPDGFSPLDGSLLEYSEDNLTFFPVVQFTNSTNHFDAIIPVGNYSDGEYPLYIKIFDEAGNNMIGTTTLHIDRTAPVLENVAVYSGGTPVPSSGYCFDTDLLIEPVAVESLSGLTLAAYGVYQFKQSSPVLDQFTVITNNHFPLTISSSGDYYLYARVTDAAGNESVETVERLIKVDTEEPSAPQVESQTHPVALVVEDAVSVNDAIFLAAPAPINPSGFSGIKGYVYELSGGTDEITATSLSQGESANGRIELINLDDNEENEYYFLAVRAKGENDLLSPGATVYPFRVDSSPPVNLKLISTTHVNPDVYYNSAQASFLWNRPMDYTGVKTYYYKTGLAAIPEEYMDMSSWVETGSTSLALDLEAMSGVGWGEVFVAVVAEDYSLNRQFSTVSVRFDTESPFIDGAINVTTDAQENSCTASWPVPVDNVPGGISRVEVKLVKEISGMSIEDLSGWVIRTPADTQSVFFNGIDSDESIIYVILLKVIDRAGNEKCYTQGFSFSGLPVESNIARDFMENIAGYTVRGKYSVDPIRQEAILELPAGFEFTVDSTAVTEIPLENLTFAGDESFLYGEDSDLLYTVNLAGYQFSGNGLFFNSTGGLFFGELALTMETAESTTKTFIYQNVSTPPQVLFNDIYTTEPVAFFYESQYLTEGIKTKCFDIDNILTTGLKESSWVFTNSTLDLTHSSGTLDAYVFGPSEEKIPRLDMTDTAISNIGVIREGVISGEFYLEASGNLFHVEEAVVREEKIVILKAKLLLDEGLTTDEINIENFSIDINGIIREGDSFQADGFSFIIDGDTYAVNELSIINNYLIITDGSVSGSANYTLDSGVLISSGISADVEGIITDYEGIFYNYTVTADIARVVDGNFVMDHAVVHMPESFPVSTLDIYGLVVNPELNAIITTGTGTAGFLLEDNYSKQVIVHEVSLTQTGFYASKIEVYLPVNILPAGSRLNLENLPLNNDGVTVTPGITDKSNEPVSLNIEGYDLLTNGTIFNGTNITFGTAWFGLTENYFPAEVIFENLCINDQGMIISPGTTVFPVEMEDSGWFFKLKNLQFSSSGITGTGEVELNEHFGERNITFQNFSILDDGDYQTGAANAEVYLRLHGWLVKASGISLSGCNVTFNTVAVGLHSSMGWGEIVIPNVEFDSEGNFLSSGTGAASERFLSTNGFEVDPSGAVFTERGLYLSGKIYFPAALGEEACADYVDPEIFMDSDGAVITEADTEAVVNYGVGGWSGIGAREYQFDREGLLIKHSAVSIPGTSIDVMIDDIRFYPDGQISVAGKSFEGFTYDIPGTTISAGVTEIGLNDEGIYIRAFITLPENFGEDAVLYFDRLTLHGDGSITSDVKVANLDFDLQGFHFSFNNISLDQTGFGIDYATIILPEALDYKQITINNLKIGNDGSFSLGGVSVDPFNLWGYIFYLDNIGFSDGVFSFEGGVRFPSDFFISELASKRLNIDTFQVSTGGEIIDFGLSITDTLTFKLFEKYDLDVTGISVNKEVFGIESGILYIPDDLSETIDVESVSVSDILINLKTGAIDVGGVTVTGISFEYEEMNFDIAEITLSSSRGLEFSGSVTLPPDFPVKGNGGGPLVLQLNTFQITPEFKIGDIDAEIAGLNGNFFDNKFILENGNIGFSKVGEVLTFSTAGTMKMGSNFPDWIAGKGAVINEFRLEYSSGSFAVTAFDAESLPLSFPLFNVVDMYGVVIGVHFNTDNGLIEVSIGGVDEANPASIVLSNDSFPDCVRDKAIKIHTFKFNSLLQVEEFSASLLITGENKILGDLWLVDHSTEPGGLPAEVKVALSDDKVNVDISITGTVKFGSEFPEGIKNREVKIDELSFDTAGNMYGLNITMPIHAGEMLLNKLEVVEAGGISVIKKGDDFLISVNGKIKLPADFPGGFENVPAIDINAFEIYTDGRIGNIDIGLTDLNLTLFNAVEVIDGSIGVVKGDEGEFIFRFGSDLGLPESMGSKFEDLQLTAAVEVSTRDGLKYFRAGLKNDQPVSIELFAGISMGFNKLVIDQDGIALAGTLTFPSSFPNGLADMTITLENFEMAWDGTINDIQAGVAEATIKLGGFTAKIEDLLFSADAITLGACRITLPASMGGTTVGLIGARWDEDGNFSYESFEGGDITVPMAGFTITLAGATLENLGTADARFHCDLASLNTPAMLGGISVDIEDVNISSAGITVGGGKFELPDFTLAGGLGFKDISVEFQIDGASYRIAGGGKILIPGAGSFKVDVAFVNKSTIYPIGLEYAFFEYKVAGIGVPLGATGFYLNAIRGGIAFGAPNEVPYQVRHLFESDGMRLSMGLTLVDQTGGAVVRGDVDVWVDIKHWDWAFKGSVSVLSGLVKSEIIAAVTGNAFYGEFNVRLAFVDGQIKVLIYKSGKKTKISGAGRLRFGLQKGSIVNKTVKIAWWKVRIIIPPSTMWLAQLNAEFGQFKNNRTGFKAWATVPVLGKVGLFAPKNGRVVIGNVSSYQLERPFSTPSARTTDSRTFAGDAALLLQEKPTYLFTVPGKMKDSIQRPNTGTTGPLKPLAGKNSRISADPEITDVLDETSTEVERIIFAVGYEHEEPMIKAISPGGLEYDAGTPGVIVERTEWGFMMAVLSPESGPWSVEITNLVTEGSYDIVVLGNERSKDLEITEPVSDITGVNDTFIVAGTVNSVDGEPVNIRIHATTDENDYINSVFTGELIAEATTDPVDNSFTVEVDASTFADGTYYIYTVSEQDGDQPSNRIYAPGSIQIDHSVSGPLPAVTEFIASETEDRSIELSFKNPAGRRVKGFKVIIEDLTLSTTEEIWIGDVTEFIIPGFNFADAISHDIRLSVIGVDMDDLEGDSSEFINLKIGGGHLYQNVFAFTGSPYPVNLQIGEEYHGSMNYTVALPVTTGTPVDFIDVAVLNAPEGLILNFDENHWDLTTGGSEITYTINSTPSLVPGIYNLKLLFENKGNRTIEQVVTLGLNVGYPDVIVDDISYKPEIFDEDISTATINNCGEVILSIRGSNYYSGTKVFLDQSELIIRKSDSHYLEAVIPAGIAPGQHTVRLTGPGGDIFESTVTVDEPYYRAILPKTTTKLQAGETGQFIIGVEYVNRYVGSAVFTVTQVPQDFSAVQNRTEIIEGEEIQLSVTAGAGVAEGLYDITMGTDRGDTITLTVEVVAAYPDPVISSLSAVSCLPGDEFTIYGYGFGDTGTVTLETEDLEVLEYSREAIRVRTSDVSISGGLTVARDGILSNSSTFYIRPLEFSLIPETNTLVYQTGETTKNVLIGVSDYNDPVSLEAVCDNEMITASLDNTFLETGDSVTLTITVPRDIPNGVYSVYTAALSGFISRHTEITVIVDSVFDIITEELPAGMASVEYEASIEYKNAQGYVTFSLLDDELAGGGNPADLPGGRLPEGLIIQSGGTVSGVPVIPEKRSFVVVASDESGREVRKELAIRVEENGWIQQDQSGGRRNYNPVKIPADPVDLWSSILYTGVTDILTGKERVFLLADDGIKALDISTGEQVFEYNGQFTNWAYGDGVLLILDTGSNLQALDPAAGNKIWQRTNIDAFVTNGDILYLSSGGRIIRVDISSGKLTAGFTGSLFHGRLYGWMGETLLGISGPSLERLGPAGWETVYTAAGDIADMACKRNSVILLSVTGTLTLLSPGFSTAGELPTGISGGELIYGDNLIFIADDTVVKAVDENSLSELYSLPGNLNAATASKNKILVAGETELRAINSRTGSQVWSMNGDFLKAITAGGDVFALSSAGEVTRYSGPVNLEAPETTIYSDPVVPDGKRMFYVTGPVINLEAQDPESFAEKIYYTINNGELTEYTAPFELAGGNHTIKAYAVDSEGLKGKDAISVFNVDTEPPVTVFSTDVSAGENGYYGDAIGVTLSAADNVSGLQKTLVRTGEEEWTEYYQTIFLNEEGSYFLSWYSEDVAGNSVEVIDREFKIDFTPPTVRLTHYDNPGMTMIYLRGEDGGSGIDRLEYRIDSENFEIYTGPVLLETEGEYEISYRAVDLAGMISSEYTESVTVFSASEGDRIRDVFMIKETGPWYVNKETGPGELIWSDCPLDPPAVFNAGFPGYLAETHQLVYSQGMNLVDDPRSITFYATADIDIYLVAHRDSSPVFSGWELYDEIENFCSTDYFPGNSAIYRRRFYKDDKAEIPGSNTATPSLVFIRLADSNRIMMESPAPGENLYPGETVGYAVNIEGISYNSCELSYTIGDSDWVPLAGETGSLELPVVSRTADFYFKIILKDMEGNTINMAIRHYKLVNEEFIEVRFPAPFTEVIMGNEVTLDYQAYDKKGVKIHKDYVTWEFRDLESDWSTLTDDSFTTSEDMSLILLKGTTGDYEVIYPYILRESYGLLLMNFNPASSGRYQQSLSGIYCGFDSNHSDSVDSYAIEQPDGSTRTYEYIKLKDNAKFEYFCGKGVFKLKLTFAGVTEDQYFEGYVEHNRLTVSYENPDYTVVRELIIEVEDGRLTIEGDYNLPLHGFQLQRLSDDEIAALGQ